MRSMLWISQRSPSISSSDEAESPFQRRKLKYNPQKQNEILLGKSTNMGTSSTLRYSFPFHSTFQSKLMFNSKPREPPPYDKIVTQSSNNNQMPNNLCLPYFVMTAPDSGQMPQFHPCPESSTAARLVHSFTDNFLSEQQVKMLYCCCNYLNKKLIQYLSVLGRSTLYTEYNN